jgi:hypothetical protein
MWYNGGMIHPNRDSKTGKWLKGRVKPIRLCEFCGIKERRIGRKFCSMECMGKARRGKQTWMKGKKHKKESLERMKIAGKGKIPWNLGKKNLVYRGKNHHFWKGGVCDLRIQITQSIEYKIWRREIFKRDNYTCQDCKQRNGYKEVHHIKPYSLIVEENHITNIQEALNCPELWELSNGKTLCLKCHRKTFSHLKNLC